MVPYADCSLKNKFIELFSIIFGILSFPIGCIYGIHLMQRNNNNNHNFYFATNSELPHFYIHFSFISGNQTQVNHYVNEKQGTDFKQLNQLKLTEPGKTGP